MEAKVFTNKICYKILLQGFNEALECIELKEFLYTPEGMAYSGEQFNMFGGSKDLIVNSKIKEFMGFAFFRFMERQQKLAESKYFISKSEFYLKCIQSLNIELTKRASKKPTTIQEMKKIRFAPFFELDDLDPLQYLSTIKWELEIKAFNEPYHKPEPEVSQQDKEIEIYIESYNENHFDEVIIKRNEDGTANNIYLGNNFNEWLTNIDRNLLANNSYDTETQDKLSTYNKYLLFLAQELIGLYKAVSGYKKTNNAGFITSIHIQENKVSQRLKSIKFYAEIVKHYIRNKQFQKANDIKEYCIALFDNCVYNLKDVLTIDVCKSPLKAHFINVKTDLKNSINFDELKLIKDLETNTTEAPQQLLKSEDTYTPKPCFKPESIESITNILNTFFDPLQHAELKRIIKTGDKANEKLLFKDSGNRLTDYLKRLYENDTITGCNKKELINWIVDNFKYTYRKTKKDFIPKTVEKIISGNEQPCKNPIT